MKNHTLFVRISYLWCALLMLPPVACTDSNENGDEEKNLPVITLTAPIDGSSADLSDGKDIVFKWKSVETDGYHLVFSALEDFSKADSMETKDTTLTLTAARLNRKLGKLGVAAGGAEPVYWTVQPAVANVEIKTKVHTLHVTRFDASDVVVLQPENGATVDLSAVAAITFAWTVTPANTPLVVLLGQKPDLSDAQSLSITTPSPLLLPADMANILLIGYGGKPGTNTLYWTILFADEVLQPDTEIRTLHVVLYAI